MEGVEEVTDQEPDQEPVKTQVHRVVLLIIDHDVVGSEGVQDVIEDARYPNRCISPEVMSIETVEVEWTDEHPLNYHDKTEAEFARLFPGSK